MRDSGKNDIVKEIMTYLEEISKYSGYVFRLLNDTGFSGNGTYSIFLKVDYAKCRRCPKCSSAKITQHGNRYTKFEVKQRLTCHTCGYRFSIDANRLRIPKNVRDWVASQKNQKSSRELQKEILEYFNIKVSHISILRMYKDTKRYFGKNKKIKKVRVKKKIEPFKRVMNGKTINQRGYFCEKEIDTIV